MITEEKDSIIKIQEAVEEFETLTTEALALAKQNLELSEKILAKVKALRTTITPGNSANE